MANQPKWKEKHLCANTPSHLIWKYVNNALYLYNPSISSLAKLPCTYCPYCGEKLIND